jgi:two-component system, OmpR family, response regulator
MMFWSKGITMHLLVIEDDPEIANQVSTGLKRLGHFANIAPTGASALLATEAQHYDVVILDRMLPDISGDEVLRHLLARSERPPVLLLSALGSVSDRIQGLQLGADDYLAKPFDMEELAARLQAIVRRTPARESEGNIAVGLLQLDAASHCATFKGAVVSLNRKQFSLLAHLMRNADRLVTRKMLLENVWGYSFEPSTNIVESNLSRLRTTLLEAGCDAIKTQRGSGYMLRSASCG